MPKLQLTGMNDLLYVALPAAARGDLDGVKWLIKYDHRFMHSIGPHGRTMLWEAAYKKRYPTIRYLLRRGADVNCMGTYFTPMIVDLSPYGLWRRTGNRQLMELAVEHGALLDLHTAAYFGLLETVKDLLAVNPELINDHPHIYSGMPLSDEEVEIPTSLTLKIEEIHEEIDEFFLDEINWVREQLQDPKVRKVEKNDYILGYRTRFIPAVEKHGELILGMARSRRKADRHPFFFREVHRAWHTWRRKWDRALADFAYIPYIHTPLHYAVHGRQYEVAKYLIAQGADVPRFGGRLLKWLTDRNDEEFFELLVAHGADVSEAADAEWAGDKRLTAIAKKCGITPTIDYRKPGDDFTLLIDACRGNHNAPDDPGRVVRLLDAGANIHETDYKGKTALHRAAQAGFRKIGTLLIKSGARVNARDDKGETPLFDAVRHGRLVTTELLLKHKADPIAANNRGKTCLDISKRSKKKDAPAIQAALEKAAKKQTRKKR